MAELAAYHLSSEVFVIPHDGMLILYAPLKGVVAKANQATAALLRDLSRGTGVALGPAEEQVLSELEAVGVVNGPPDLRLTVHEYGAFAPTHVTLFLTNACNLRCTYCYARGGDSPRPVLIPMDAARAGIDLVARNAVDKGTGAFSVGFHGAGEPTVAWERHVELVEYAKGCAQDLGLRVSCSTCTNGVMPESHARWMAAHTQTATVSVDGLPADHDRQRPRADGGGSFDDVSRTLRIFDELGFFYAIRATITEDNVHTMAEMIEFLDDHFAVGDLQFDPLIVSGRCDVSGCRPPADEVYVEQFVRAYETARRRGRMVGFSCLSFASLKSFYCCAVSDGFTVTHEGNVTACFEVFDAGHPCADTFIYGRYHPERGAFELDLERLKRLQTRHVYNLPYCRDCFCKYMCSGDCPIHSLKMGYGMERGVRCQITQAVAKHRLATILNESEPHAIVAPTRMCKEVSAHA